MNKNSFDLLRLSVNIRIDGHIFFLACPISNKSDKIKRKRETLRSRNPFANGPLHFIQGDDQGHTRQVLAAHCRMHWTSTSKWGPSVESRCCWPRLNWTSWTTWTTRWTRNVACPTRWGNQFKLLFPTFSNGCCLPLSVSNWNHLHRHCNNTDRQNRWKAAL